MTIRAYCPACGTMTRPTIEDAPATHCSGCQSGYPCDEHDGAHFLTLAEIVPGCARPAPEPAYSETPDPTTGLRPPTTDAIRVRHWLANIIADQEERDRDAAEENNR